jgi:uncharacterized protein
MLLDQIESDFKQAMKDKNEITLNTLRMFKSAVKNKEIEKKVKSLSEDELFEVIQKQIKQRRDSVVDFKKGNREDLVTKELNEISVLERYLPKQLTEQELKDLVGTIIQSVGAKTKADMGKVMKEVLSQTKGKADGKMVSSIVSGCLA